MSDSKSTCLMNKIQPEIIASRGYSASNNKLECIEKKMNSDLIITSTLVNTGDEVKLDFVCPVIFEFIIDDSMRNVRFYVNGYTSFSGTGSFHMDEKEPDTLIPHLRQVHRNFYLPVQKRKGFFTSSLFGILKTGNSSYYTMGFLNCENNFTQIKTVRYNKKFALLLKFSLREKS